MTYDADLEDYFARLTAVGGTPPLTPEETDAVLDLTKVVAHTAERYYAPLAAYVVGLAIGAGTDQAERAARVRALIDVARKLRKPPPDG
ncbi:MAG: DUF6457 domain-containing protein [Egibacteraceae bacterium]